MVGAAPPLQVQHDGPRLCVQLAASRACARVAPYGPFEALTTRGAPGGRIAVAVGPAVASVGFATVGGATEPVPVAGRPGLMQRFAVLRVPATAYALRTYDASGALIGVAHADLARPGETDVVRAGPVRAARPVVPDPDPVDLERTRAHACVHARGATFCVPGGEPRLLVSALPACAPQRPVVYGFAGGRRVTLTLGTGRILTPRTKRLPAAYGGLRLVAIRAPRHTALRELADGRSVQQLAMAPSGYPCPGGAPHQGAAALDADYINGLTTFPDELTEVAAAGRFKLRVGDRGRQLCAEVNGSAGTCAVPPVTAHRLAYQRRGTAYGAVVPDFVARLRLHFAGGATRSVPAVGGDAYRGRYAGHVRFVLFDAGGRVVRATPLAAGGTVVGRATRLAPPQREARAHLVRRRLPGLPLQVFALTGGPACVGPTNPDRHGFVSCRGLRGGAFEAFCRPRRAFGWGYLAPGAAPPVLELRGGGRQTTTGQAVPAGGGRIWFAEPRGEVVAVRFARRRVVAHVAPVAQQCGYGLSLR